jgi:RNA recognition motif-containing protein
MARMVHTFLDPTTKQSKGLAYVSFANPENALKANSSMEHVVYERALSSLDRRCSLTHTNEAGRYRGVGSRPLQHRQK